MRTVITADPTPFLNELLSNLNNAISNSEFKKRDLLSFYPKLEALKNSPNKELALLHVQSGKTENNLCQLMDLLSRALLNKQSDIADLIVNILLSDDYFTLNSDWFFSNPVAIKKLLNALEYATKNNDMGMVRSLLRKCDRLFLQSTGTEQPKSFLRASSTTEEYVNTVNAFFDSVFFSCSENTDDSIKNLFFKFLSFLISHDRILEILSNAVSIRLLILLNNFSGTSADAKKTFESILSQILNNEKQNLCLLAILNEAVKNNSDIISSASDIFHQHISKMDPISLFNFLNKKSKRDENYTQWFDLIDTLHLAAKQKKTLATTHLEKIISDCAAKLDAIALTQLLFEKVTTGNYAGKNTLYLLIGALTYTDDNNDSMIRIITFIQFAIDKCAVDEDELTATLAMRGGHGKSIFRGLMLVLSNAAYHNYHEAIRCIINFIHYCLNKCNSAQTIITTMREEPWFLLTSALTWAIDKKNDLAARNISKIIYTLLEKYHDNDATLITAWTEKPTDSNYEELNAFYNLILALYLAGMKKNEEATQSTATLLLILLNKFKEDPKLLIAVLAAKKPDKMLDLKNTMGFLLVAITYATYINNDAAISNLINFFQELPEKYNADIATLAAVLHEEFPDRFCERKNIWQTLADALFDATVRSECGDQKAIRNVSTLMQFCLAKCNTSLSLASVLNQPEGWRHYKGGCSLLIKTLETEIFRKDKQSQAHVCSCILDILSKLKPNDLTDETRSALIEKRDHLVTYFKDAYFSKKVKQIGLTAIDAACKSETMLGSLIDHKDSLFSFGDTNTRKFVSDFMRNEKEKISRVSQNIQRIKQVLDNFINVKNHPLINAKYEEFVQALDSAKEMCEANKIADFKIDGKTLEELRLQYFVAVKNLTMEYPSPTTSAEAIAQPALSSTMSNSQRLFASRENPVRIPVATATVAPCFDDLQRISDLFVPQHRVETTASPARASQSG